MSLKTVREAIQAEVAADLGIDFVAGRIDANPRRSLGCCWSATVEEVAGHVLEENIEVFIRVFVPWQQRVEPSKPIDPVPLEELADTIRAALSDKQSQIGWLFRVTRCELDYDLHCVDAAILVWQANAFNVAS